MPLDQTPADTPFPDGYVRGVATPSRPGVCLVVCGPSGIGKSTIIERLVKSDGNLRQSISVTTRARRANEIDGVHYHFVTKEQFQEYIDGGEMIEHATVLGNSYGIRRKNVEDALKDGRDLVFGIDWKGYLTLRRALGDAVIGIMLLPPGMDELRRRLLSRNDTPEEDVAVRLGEARFELSRWGMFDHVVVNDVLDEAVDDVRAILRASRLARPRSDWTAAFTGIDPNEFMPPVEPRLTEATIALWCQKVLDETARLPCAVSDMNLREYRIFNIAARYIGFLQFLVSRLSFSTGAHPPGSGIKETDPRINAVENFRFLEADWDEQGASKPSERSIADAVVFLRTAGPIGVCLEPMLDGDGVVMLRVGENGNSYFRFVGDGSASLVTLETAEPTTTAEPNT